MSLLDIVILSVGLAMDAFAVSICKGLSVEKAEAKGYLAVGIWFGLFQAIMPIIGYFLSSAFEKIVDSVDHWIAFVLLVLIGANMIKEAFSKAEEAKDASFSLKTMLVLAFATSIDALAVGVTLAFTPQKLNIFVSVGIIGLITAFISMAGFKVGSLFGSKYKSKAEFAGGVILILLGVKILIEGLTGITLF